MSVNGLVHLLRRKNVTYELTYAPLGALVGSCPPGSSTTTKSSKPSWPGR